MTAKEFYRTQKYGEKKYKFGEYDFTLIADLDENNHNIILYWDTNTFSYIIDIKPIFNNTVDAMKHITKEILKYKKSINEYILEEV